MNRPLRLLALLALPALGVESATARPATLDLAARIAAQEKIERVFYAHRIWPKENPGPKPPFEAMVPRELIETRARDGLLKSAALEQYWGVILTPEMLQRELDRMGRETLAPETLRELFAALGSDPQRIGEILARDTLADRLIRNRFAYDERFQGAALRQAREFRELGARQRDWRALGGEYARTLNRRDTSRSAQPPPHGMENPEINFLTRARFELLERGALPVGEVSELEETADGFRFQRTAARQRDEILIESITVKKQSFDAWWKEVAGGLFEDVTRRAEWPSATGLHLPAITTVAGCDEWDDPMKINKMPEARTGHSAVWTGSEMIIWGGWNDDDPSGLGRNLNSGGRYDPATDSWRSTSMGDNNPSPRSSHLAVWTGSEMILWGGIDGMGLRFTDGGRYNPAGDSWRTTSTGTGVPSGRDAGSAVWTGTEMIIWGGYAYEGSWQTLNSGSRYNPTTDSWQPTSLGTNVPSPRKYFSAIWTGTEMIVWGGCGAATGNVINCTTVVNDGGRYDPATDSWTPMTMTAAPSARTIHATIWSGTEMIVWGGCTAFSSGCTSVTNSGGRYNPANNSWVATSAGTNVPTPRAPGRVAIWSGSEMIVWGGTYDQSGGRYSPASDSWLPTSTGAGVPQHRSNETAIWTGSEMILWGGYDMAQSPTEYLNSGGRYKPTTDSWLATADVNVPRGREGHSATWTGGEMIVWGGRYTLPGNAVVYLNSGARFFPATSSWLPTEPITNTPSPRSTHTAIWTGIELIVWGGLINSNPYYLKSGGRYSPAANNWVPTAMETATPIERAAHTAVWTGDEMIVWGGIHYDGTFYAINSGGRYGSSSNSWQATSIGTYTPSPRSYHNAIWTGNEMIIWGGGSATGGSYTPTSGLWRAIPANSNASDSPSSVIWTGAEVLVWGGYEGSYLNSGMKFTPWDDGWSSMTVGFAAPLGRNFPSTVWTGTEMILWGGAQFGTPDLFFNSGGRYSPTADWWKSTSTAMNVPRAAYGHVAIWTGSIMIVWGGQVNYHYYQGGGYHSGSVASPGNSLRLAKSPALRLAWTSVSGAGSYAVKRCTPSLTGCIPGTIVSTPTISQYSEPQDGLSHFYAVEAVNQCGATP